MTRLSTIPRPTFAAVTATLALVVALAGSSYAAVQLNGRDIKRHSIPGNRLEAQAVVPAAKSARTTQQIVLPKLKKKRHGRVQVRGDVLTLAAGDVVTLIQHGQFSLIASCPDSAHPTLFAKSSKDGWFNSRPDGNLVNNGPHPAGTPVTISAISQSGNATLATLPPFVLLGANGEALHVGPIDMGGGVLGEECVFTGYAVSG
jgi:hypothetical protein